MDKSKLYIIIIIGLLLSNILLIISMTNHKPHRPMHGGPRNEIIMKLNFDENQIQLYDSLIKGHRKSIDKKENSIIELKNLLYSELRSSKIKPEKDSIINEIAKIQIEIEHIHYNHFDDIKKICKPEQLNNYNELIKEIARLFSKPPPPPMDKPRK